MQLTEENMNGNVKLTEQKSYKRHQANLENLENKKGKMELIEQMP